ncbi:MAG TPA: transcriptional regulator [Clostridiales bacterium]|nr:transcriptional regulator [Clostridiales bacterium]
MSQQLSQVVGSKIREMRKSRGISLTQLADAIHKGASTVYKYETGDISMDLETLNDIASFLSVSPAQLLYIPEQTSPVRFSDNTPSFFSNLSQFYSYEFDGRSNRLIRCVFDLIPAQNGDAPSVTMYMNFKDYSAYQNCENTYSGFIEHYDAVTNIVLINKASPIERASVQILASYMNSDTKWGLFNGFSSRPMMPVAFKMLFSKRPLKEDAELLRQLKISKEDIRLLKLYNMFSVT